MLKRDWGKQLTNEGKYPHIVELAMRADGLDVELNRRMIEFHQSRQIQPRHGRRTIRDPDEARRIAANIANAVVCF